MYDFLNDQYDTASMVNNNLIRLVQRRGNNVFSPIHLIIDEDKGMYNDQITYCPWSQPLPMTQNRANVPKEDSRDVCYSVKVGPNQLETAIVIDDNDPEKEEQNKAHRSKAIEEVIEELKEFNFGNCLQDINPYLFANYMATLYTTVEFKYSIKANSQTNKYQMITPENFYFVREKLHGSVRDVIDQKFEFIEGDKNFHDVIVFQMVRAVNIIHSLGWAHRDIKPENFYIKSTVDHRLEVYLGEFKNSVMNQNIPAKLEGHENVEDHVHGGPFYMSNDATEHAGDKANDIYALGMSLMELMTHEDIEQVFVEKTHKNLVEFADREVFEQESVALVLERQTFELAQEHDVTPKKNVDNHSKSIELTMDFQTETFNDFNINEFDFSNFELVSKENEATYPNLTKNRILSTKRNLSETRNLSPEDLSQNRNLSAERNLSKARNLYAKRNLSEKKGLHRNRLLAEKDNYGNSSETMNFFEADDYATKKYNPNSELEIKEDLIEASKILDFDVLNNESHLMSLPSVDTKTLTFENTLQVDQIITTDFNTKSIFVDDNTPKKQGEIENGIKLNMGNGQVGEFNAQVFASQLVKSFILPDTASRSVRAPGNKMAAAACNKDFQTHLNGLKNLHKNFKTGLNTLECLMVLVAMAIDERPQKTSESGANYFNNLFAEYPSPTKMTDVFNIIIKDRMVTTGHDTTQFSAYMEKRDSELDAIRNNHYKKMANHRDAVINRLI